MTTPKIIYCSWGYSMTIVEFFQVIKETEKTILVVPMKQHQATTGYLSGTTVPTEPLLNHTPSRFYKRSRPGSETYFKGTVKTERGTSENGTPDIYTRSNAIAWEWNGEPKSFNHCD